MYLRTPIGKINLLSILFVLVVFGAVAAGLIIPGRTGEVIEVIAWIVIALAVALELGLRRRWGAKDPNERLPW
jgi:hypothetical protein